MTKKCKSSALHDDSALLLLMVDSESEAFNKSLGIAGDEKLFVGLNDEGLYAGVGSRDIMLLTVIFNVKFFIDLDAEVIHILADLAAQVEGVLADTAGESDSVNTVHCSGVSTNVLLDLIAESVSGERCTIIAGEGEVNDITGVGGLAGETDESALLVEEGVHLCGGKTFLLHEIENNRRINTAGTGTHDNTVKRGKAHGGVNRLALVDSSDGGTVSEVAGDDLELFDGLAHHLGAAGRNVAVRGTVEAVAADVIFLIILIGDTEDISLIRHSLMEGSIKYSSHRNFSTENVAASLHGNSLRRIVERSEILEGYADIVDNFIGDQGGYLILLAAVENTVTDSGNLIDVGDYCELAGCESAYQLFKSILMGCKRFVFLYGTTVGDLMGDDAVNTDTLNVTLCNNRFICHVDELILKGGTSCIDYQNFHFCTIPYIYIFLFTAQN